MVYCCVPGLSFEILTAVNTDTIVCALWCRVKVRVLMCWTDLRLHLFSLESMPWLIITDVHYHVFVSPLFPFIVFHVRTIFSQETSFSDVNVTRHIPKGSNSRNTIWTLFCINKISISIIPVTSSYNTSFPHLARLYYNYVQTFALGIVWIKQNTDFMCIFIEYFTCFTPPKRKSNFNTTHN